ncbi:hypothetical protein [Dyella sp.]|uniref:hypothetical protein n=1 Tax=Dyella sp. TaxID=1869338 RepID=UPI002840AF98|nr:hypothetical protein [Dyella sp.]MDR3447493.1 hypothetical protein [Dyella sp.]
MSGLGTLFLIFYGLAMTALANYGHMPGLAVIGLAVLLFALGTLEAFFPATARRFRGIDDSSPNKSPKLIFTERYILAFRLGGVAMICFGVVMLWGYFLHR